MHPFPSVCMHIMWQQCVSTCVCTYVQYVSVYSCMCMHVVCVAGDAVRDMENLPFSADTLRRFSEGIATR